MMEATSLKVGTAAGGVTTFFEEDGPFKVWWKSQTETPRLIVCWENNDGDRVINEFPAENVVTVRTVQETADPAY